MNPTLDVALREEVMTLRKKVVVLETAESDNERLRKEMMRLKRQMQEEQSKVELEFMNQLSKVARENAIKVEDITDELREANDKNRALSEQLTSKGSTSKPIDSLLLMDEVEKLKCDLKDAQNSRDNLSKKLKESMRLKSTPTKDEVEKLRSDLRDAEKSRDNLFKKLKESTRLNSTRRKDSETKKSNEISRIQDENRSLKNTIESLQKENREMKVRLNEHKVRQALYSDHSKKDAEISDLKKEIQELRESAKRVENESRDLNNSSRNDSKAEQIREPGRPRSLERSESGTGESRSSRIIQRMKENLKNDREMYMDLQKDTKISELEAELSSTKGLLAFEKSNSRKQENELVSELETLRETLSDAEISKTALTLDKERLIAQTETIQEEKVELELKAKKQHQQLKQLRNLVEKHLSEVDKNHKNDEIEIQSQRDQVDSLKRELLQSQLQVTQLQKRIGKIDGTESTVDHLVKLNVQSLQTQLNTLQKQLSCRNNELSELQLKYKKEINALEKSLDSSRLDLRDCMEGRNKDIERFKSLAEEKENENKVLERGKEQLILSMQDMVKNRRDEVDEFQSEMVEMNNRLANETKKVSTLRSRLEQSDYPAKEMGRLRKRITELSRQLSQKENENTSNLTAVENRELRRQLKELQMSVSERGSSSKPVQVLRERNAALKEEVERLRRKLEKLSARNEMQPYVVQDGVTRMMI